jgi:hypothetical protein
LTDGSSRRFGQDEPVARSPLAVDRLAVAREGADLVVYDDDGRLGRFVVLPDADAVELLDDDGAAVLSLRAASAGARAHVDVPDGRAGVLSRVGRVRVNFEVRLGDEVAPAAVFRPLRDGSGWVAMFAVLRAWPLDGGNRYALELAGAAVDPALRPLLVALPAFADSVLT